MTHTEGTAVRLGAYVLAPVARTASPPRSSRTGKRSLPPWPGDRPLRAWQREAAAAVLAHAGPSFLASATPAAGKTTFGLHVAHRLLTTGAVSRVVVVAPTTHICRQWAADAARYGIDLEPNRPNSDGPEPADRHGVAVTYATVAASPKVHRNSAPTLLIADEPHHMGEEAAWGRATLSAFAGAKLRLLLSGTPFRSDNTAIPWVRYDDSGVSAADYAYGYTDALLDGVCRPVTFHCYDGEMAWVSAGRHRTADFSVGLPAAESARRLRTALDPAGDWLTDVLRDAHQKLSGLRRGTHPDAGGLVIAIDKEHAESLAARLAVITGRKPEIVTSDAPDASQRISRFAAGRGEWLVSVLMVSEGVDIPRLRVGVYATTARTELFFRQVVGRFIRRTPAPKLQMSHVFLPSDPVLKRLAAEVEEERNHALDGPGEDGELIERTRGEGGEPFHALWSSARREDEVLQTTQPGDQVSLFGEPAAAAVPETLAPATGRAPKGETPEQRRARLREERAALVSVVARKTGETHRAVHARANRATGAASVGGATARQLAKGNALLRKELD